MVEEPMVEEPATRVAPPRRSSLGRAGAPPSLSRASTCALASSSSDTTSARPAFAAIQSAEMPLHVRRSTPAPALSSVATTCEEGVNHCEEGVHHCEEGGRL